MTFKCEAAVKLYKRVCCLCLHFSPLFHSCSSIPPFFCLRSLYFSSSPPPSKGDSCLSLINAWHLAQRVEGRDAGEERGGTREGRAVWARHIGRDGEK